MMSRVELHSIVHAGTNRPTIDTDCFPGTVSAWYWTGTPHAGGADSPHAWAVNFDQMHWGTSGAGGTSMEHATPARLVRVHE